MATLEERYDDAVYEFTLGHTDEAIAMLREVLAEDPGFFDAQLALGNAYYSKGDYPAAITEGHKAEKLNPHDQLVHTNLSKAYMKTGNKLVAEHHALQSRIASWRGNMAAPTTNAVSNDLTMAPPPAMPPVKVPEKFPDMPWKRKQVAAPPSTPAVPTSGIAPTSGHYVSVADVASLQPGHGRTVHLDGREFALFFYAGEFFAMDDLCPHRGASLGSGQLEAGRVACPMHGWTFDVKTGACQNNPDRPVKTYPTRIANGQVQILIPPFIPQANPTPNTQSL